MSLSTSQCIQKSYVLLFVGIICTVLLLHTHSQFLFVNTRITILKISEDKTNLARVRSGNQHDEQPFEWCGEQNDEQHDEQHSEQHGEQRNEQNGEPVTYILSAFGSETMNYSGFITTIKVNGWMYTKYCFNPIKCCILWLDDVITTISSPRMLDSKLNRNRPSKLFAPQITCSFDGSLQNVAGVAVELKDNVCPSKEGGRYVRPSIPETTDDDESFAICLKIVYDHVDTKHFIDWMEYHRTMKVDKVFMFTYNITEATHDVIRHYVEIGLAESRYFDYPLKSEFPNLDVKTEDVFKIHRPTIHDCLQRTEGYKYLAIVDLDEMLLPRRHRDVKELMKYLMKEHPDAAGFTLPSCIFDKNQQPDPSAPINATDARKYIRRSPPTFARHKNILLPTRTTADGLGTHGFMPSKHYQRVHVNSSDATINHYRRCYENLKKNLCLNSNMTEDRHILQFIDNVKTEI